MPDRRHPLHPHGVALLVMSAFPSYRRRLRAVEADERQQPPLHHVTETPTTREEAPDD